MVVRHGTGNVSQSMSILASNIVRREQPRARAMRMWALAEMARRKKSNGPAGYSHNTTRVKCSFFRIQADVRNQ
jgi:hypothetical protein